MFTSTIRTFLAQPLIARMGTIDPNGYPHIVPVWFYLDNDEIVIISERSTRKVSYIQTNPKGAITIGGDPGDGQGYLLKGRFAVEEDPDLKWMETLTRHYEDKEQAEKDITAWSKLDMIVIRMTPETIASVL